MIVEKQMECRLAGETKVLGGKLPQCHFCPSQNPTLTDPGLNPGRRGGKPATIIIIIIIIIFIWFVRLLALRPLLAYCASFG
jgi:hypothetical protein